MQLSCEKEEPDGSLGLVFLGEVWMGPNSDNLRNLLHIGFRHDLLGWFPDDSAWFLFMERKTIGKHQEVSV